MAERPSGTVTFLFTDVEGSTRRWEENPDAMEDALAAHDDVLRMAVERHEGWVFKHTGDGVCAAFRSARSAVDAAIAAQRVLGLPVRMGAATGEASERGGDYFGPVLNRTARVMDAGHGGQVLLEGLTAGLVDGVEVLDLGEHRLRDLSGPTRLFQVVADGLRSEFPPLRTVDSVPGNLPIPATSFVGRDEDLRRLADVVRTHRMVTLTGVGGVGKTRLAVNVASELAADHPGGAWFVELASVADPGAVRDVVATTLGIQVDVPSVADIASALDGRRMLLVLDNCEHVLDSVVSLVEGILARTRAVTVLATSREALGIGSEHLFVVRPLDTQDGVDSAAVTLFVERAQAVVVEFSLSAERDASAVVEICRRLDGIALAIELAAARIVSMTPSELLDRLADRFRLLAGSRRGLERHQTLRHAIGWSFDLLSADDREVLCCCSVFADGFDLASAGLVCGGERDEYAILEILDSLVRKSLLSIERIGARSRYRMVETVRQYGEDQLGMRSGDVRDRHLTFFAQEVIRWWDEWDSPAQRRTLDLVDVEFGNLRSALHWAGERQDVVAATTIAAHVALLAFCFQRYEAVGWAEELLPVARTADVPMLPRLLTAASLCTFIGRPSDGLEYAREASRHESAGGHDRVTAGLSRFMESVGLRMCGDVEHAIETCRTLATEGKGVERVLGQVGVLYNLPNLGRGDEARTIADEIVEAARAHGNPWIVGLALDASARAFAETDPVRTLEALREALVYARAQRLTMIEGILLRDTAALTAVCEDVDDALDLFSLAIEMLRRSGGVTHLHSTLGQLATLLARMGRADAATMLYGATTQHATVRRVPNLDAVVDQLRTVLGPTRFEQCIAAGAAMDTAQAIEFAQQQISYAR